LKQKKIYKNCVISSFRREVDEKCALLGNYAANSGNYLLTFQVRNCLYSLIITQKSVVFSIKTGRINSSSHTVTVL